MNCDLTPQIDRFIGVDYAQRRIAWTVMDDIGVIQSMDELALPALPDDNCHLCQLGMLADYVDANMTDRWVTPRTLVAIELPIYGLNVNTQTKMAMVAGMVVASITRSTDKHVLVPPATWKKDFTGNGHATKQDVAQAALEHYPHLNQPAWAPSQDQFDSIGIARWAMRRAHMPAEV